MAEKLLDSLLIHIGVNADEVKAGIQRAAQSFENLRSSVEATGKPIDGMVTQYSKGALLMAVVRCRISAHYGDRHNRAENRSGCRQGV